ncbi:MAG: MmcQ/YjbR family DNA-binding protein, partial [Caulobacteraceae bacterium]
MTADDIRALALSLPLAEEQPHFDRASFRVKGRIFATLPPGGEQVVLKLPAEIKESLRQSDPDAIVPVDRTRPLPLSDAQRQLWLLEQVA